MKVLIVDDDPTIRMIAQMALEQLENWEVLVAESGTEAMTVLPAEKPDLLLIDMRMPGMDGPTTVANLRESNQLGDTRIIFITADDRARDVCKAAGAIGYVTKPFDPIKLPDEIKAIIG